MENCTCRWCGYSSSKAELSSDANEEGFWCPDCDGYTYFDQGGDIRRMLLLLESKDDGGNTPSVGKTKLRKRLSPLRYPGGKSKVIDQIYGKLDDARLDTFVELFAGGASLGLSLLEAGKINKLIINDTDVAVSTFWKQVFKSPYTDIVQTLESTPEPTLEDFRKARDVVQDFRENIRNGWISEYNNLGFSYLLLNRLSFGGIGERPICGWSGTNEELRQRWNPAELIKRIHTIRAMEDRIEVTNKDAIGFFTDVAGWLPRDSTVFVDPPYTVAGLRLYKETFAGKHEELAMTLNSFFCSWPGPDIILTYDDCEMIHRLYPYAETSRLQTSWSIGRKGARAS